MLTISNVLSLSRAGLAFAFLQPNTFIRLLAIVLAALTDFLDGFIARKTRTKSQLGAILDPLSDKFFVIFVASILFVESRLGTFDLVLFLSRDISLCFFGVYLLCVRGWKEYEVSGIFWGKLTTFAQFVVLTGLTVYFVFPLYIYLLFALMGVFAFIELVSGYKAKTIKK